MKVRGKRQGPDNGLRPLIRENLREGMMWTTIETGLVTQGVPDINYLSDGGCEGWVECKATRAWNIRFKPMQIGWHERRARYGGRSWIAVRRQHGGGSRLGAAVDELYLVPGCFVVELAREGLDCGRAIFFGDGGPLRWRWSDVRRHLLGRVVTRG